MAEIKVVIKIPEEMWKQIKKGYVPLGISKYLKNGVTLPKEHGDLKDMGNLPYVFDLTREDFIYSGKDIERAIKSMTTIIEADVQNKE